MRPEQSPLPLTARSRACAAALVALSALTAATAALGPTAAAAAPARGQAQVTVLAAASLAEVLP